MTAVFITNEGVEEVSDRAFYERVFGHPPRKADAKSQAAHDARTDALRAEVLANIGGWVAADWEGGWTCYVEQGFYGHWSRKPTWLLAYHCDLPSLRWGEGEQRIPEGAIEQFGYAKARRRGVMVNIGGGGNASEREATPPEFRDLLLSIARTAVNSRQEAA